MNKSNSFLEFVKQTPPPCVPGDDLYWFDPSTGNIRKQPGGITQIALDSNWQWKIVDEEASDTLITPDEDPYFCITAEAAKKFRDKIEQVQYLVFKPDSAGPVFIDDNPFVFFKACSLHNLSELQVTENYFTAILRQNADVKPGMVIMFNNQSAQGYIINKDLSLKDTYIHVVDKYTKRLIEDAFD